MRLTVTMADLVRLFPQSGRYDGLAATADMHEEPPTGGPAFYVSLDGGPVFYDDPDAPGAGRQLVRWAFCKEADVIDDALRRLAGADLRA